MTRLRAWLRVFIVVALGGTSAEAAISRESSGRPLLGADRVTAEYSLSLPSLADRLKAAEERLERGGGVRGAVRSRGRN